MSMLTLGTRAPSPAIQVGATCGSEWVLSTNDVHTWRVPLDQSSERTMLSLKILSQDEREKAARFRFNKDRNQFVQARAALRRILGEYLDVPPQTLVFSYGDHGKPALPSEVNKDLRFNLSRRQGLALIAVTRGREIGVDVELVRVDLPFFEIADVSFSLAESATLTTLSESLRVAGFYNCWTRKEAFVKARGEGLLFPLQQFDVSLTPGDPVTLLDIRGEIDQSDRWTLHEIPVDEEYVAALAVKGTDLTFTCRDWLSA